MRRVLVLATTLVGFGMWWWQVGGPRRVAGGEREVEIEREWRVAGERAGNAGDGTRASADDRGKVRRLREAGRRSLRVAAAAVATRRECAFEAEIGEGQSIVTGGYRTEDGRFEFTVLSPERVPRQDGTMAYTVAGRLIVLDEALVAETGLATLTAGGGEGPQHAEAWEAEELQGAMARWLDSEKDADLLAAPTVMTVAGMEFSVLCGKEGGTSYQLQGRVEESANGKMAVSATVSRVMER